MPCPHKKGKKKRKHTPITSGAEKKLYGIARGIQKGETPASYSPTAAKIAKTVSPEVLRSHIKEVKGKKLPRHVRQKHHSGKTLINYRKTS